MRKTAVASLSFLIACVACGGGQPPPAPPPSSAAPPSDTGTASATAAPTANADGGSPAPAAEATPPAAASAAPASTPPGEGGGTQPPRPGQWDSWSKEQKMAYMKAAVLPKMGPLFHDFDAKRFAEPKCVTCHGAGAKDGSFKMPNPALPKLPATPEGFKKLHDAHPKVVDFMANQVVPTMAALVGEPPYDPKTQKGFGCFECHTKK
ncbi:MAG: hypothetical protein JOZ69_14245 [Myxococcales bacterium]|nr:hypothetical protein [Myxococcales bacterium]